MDRLSALVTHELLQIRYKATMFRALRCMPMPMPPDAAAQEDARYNLQGPQGPCSCSIAVTHPNGSRFVPGLSRARADCNLKGKRSSRPAEVGACGSSVHLAWRRMRCPWSRWPLVMQSCVQAGLERPHAHTGIHASIDPIDDVAPSRKFPRSLIFLHLLQLEAPLLSIRYIARHGISLQSSVSQSERQGSRRC